MSGLAVIAVSMVFFTQLSADTSLPLMCVALFVMGLGMGCTMMPTMTAAIQTLTHAQVARGSTLMNIVNQAAGSIGTATMSVLLTNMLENKPLAQAAIGSQFDPTIAQKVPPEQLDTGFDQAATAYAHTYIVALVLVLVTLIPAAFLPRSKPKLPQEDADAPVLMGH
jgi:fucose permease